MIVPSLWSQLYKLEARFLRDVYANSYVTNNAEIVMYLYCLTRTALSADRDVMGVAWVVRDSLWNASSAPWDRREVSAESWAHRTLEVASIDMDNGPALLAAQVYCVRNAYWVLRLLLVSPTCTLLCVLFDPLSNRPYIVGANIEELAIVDLIAEQEGIEPRPRKKWDRFLDGSGITAFAIALLYSTFLRQRDGVSYHPAYLLMPHCPLFRRAVNGNMQLPQDRLWLLREIAEAALHFRNSAYASPNQTTLSWALARMDAGPHCPPNRSSCFFLFCHDTIHMACPACGVYQ